MDCQLLLASGMRDAFLFRLLLVPALMPLAGRAARWLPRPLDRRLPDLYVEGAGLRARTDTVTLLPDGSGAATTRPTRTMRSTNR